MRGALQAKSVHLAPSLPGIQWSSLIARQRHGRRVRALDQFVQLERFQREQRRQASLGQLSPDPSRQWIRRF